MRIESSPQSPTHPQAAGTVSSPLKSSPNGTNGKILSNGSYKGSMERPQYLGLDSEELTRLMVQMLEGMGYRNAASTLMQESGYQVESPLVSDFRSAVLRGDWTMTETLLFGDLASTNGQAKAAGLQLSEGIDPNTVRFWIRKQKFLELLEAGDLSSALYVLRSELTPLNHDTADLHALSSLMMCDTPEELKEQSDWDGAGGQSRSKLLVKLSNSISSAVMIPENRLAVILNQYRANIVEGCTYHNQAALPTLLSDHHCEEADFPLTTVLELSQHDEEVWAVAFSPDGKYLATGGQDKAVFIYDTETFEVLWQFTGHEGGAGHISWSPDSQMIAVCGAKANAKVWSIAAGALIMTVTEHREPISSTTWTPDSASFISASFDRTAILWSIEGRELYRWQGSRIRTCALTPDGQRLITGTSDKQLVIYNFHTREPEVLHVLDQDILSIAVSKDSSSYLLSLAEENNQCEPEIQLRTFDASAQVRRYDGHQCNEFVVRCEFGGATEMFIAAGSADSKIYIWHRDRHSPLEILEGHTDSVNAISWSPTNPEIFASCSDDRTVRIWSKMNLTSTEQAIWEGRRQNSMGPIRNFRLSTNGNSNGNGMDSR